MVKRTYPLKICSITSSAFTLLWLDRISSGFCQIYDSETSLIQATKEQRKASAIQISPATQHRVGNKECVKFISGIQKVRTAQRVVSRKNKTKQNKKQCGVGIAGIKCATLYLYHWNRLSETGRTFHSHSRGDWLWKVAKLKDWHQQGCYNFCWELP